MFQLFVESTTIEAREEEVSRPIRLLVLNRGGTVLGSLWSVDFRQECRFTVKPAANMVRTKADSVPGSYRKAVAASAPRKSLGASSSNATSNSQSSTPAKNKYAGGNPVCPRPTPTWQKGIGDFFGGPPRKMEKENRRPQEVEDDEEAGGSGMSKASRKARPLPAEDEEDDD